MNGVEAAQTGQWANFKLSELNPDGRWRRDGNGHGDHDEDGGRDPDAAPADDRLGHRGARRRAGSC
ncbi:MAG: hypothetical protein IPG47_10245 [Thermoflexaceae bacterium]|nr:hypothetical protein [Thermoflexaceae bacterium]